MIKLGIVTSSIGNKSEIWLLRQIRQFRSVSPHVLTWNLIENDSLTSNISLVREFTPAQPNNRYLRFVYKRIVNIKNIFHHDKYWKEIDIWLKETSPDIILCHFGPVGLEVLPVAKKNNIPIACHFHGQDLSGLLTTNKKYKNKLIKNINKFDAIIVVGTHQKQWMLDHGVPNEKVNLIPCGVPVDEFPYKKRSSPSKIKISAVSRLVEKKGIKYTISAFNIARKHIDATLEIIGDGPLKNQLESQARSSEYYNDIIFCGELDTNQVKEKLYQTDIFVQHSVDASDGDLEGFGVSVAEAASTGLPVICSNATGLKDQVVNGETGYLTPQRDVKEYADKIVKLSMNPNLREQMGLSGRQRMEIEYNTPDQVKKLEKVLLEISTNE